MRRLLVLVLCSCDVGDADLEDTFWADTTDDDGTDPDVLAAGADRRVSVTGGQDRDAERIQLVPVGRSENTATRRVALQLTPAQLPKLAVGDRLIVPAELQVTTRCDIGQTAPGCNYNPNVRAQLILAGSATATSGSGNAKVIATQQQSCTKNEHHCMFVFTPSEAAIRLGSLPCVVNGGCFVNLVVTAWHPDARGGDQDKLLVGGNDGNFLDNGRVDPDQARIMAIRERRVTGADRAMRETSGSGSKSINTNANAELVYSHRLKSAGQPLKKGEQFVVEAKVATNVGGRVRFSAEMFVTRDGNAAEGGGFEKVEPAAINEQNGINCDAGGSCVLRKVAVFRVTEDVDDAVFVNVGVKSAVPGGGSARVTVSKAAGFVRVMRYRAALAD
jgi:hypothetical protein